MAQSKQTATTKKPNPKEGVVESVHITVDGSTVHAGANMPVIDFAEDKVKEEPPVIKDVAMPASFYTHEYQGNVEYDLKGLLDEKDEALFKRVSELGAGNGVPPLTFFRQRFYLVMQERSAAPETGLEKRSKDDDNPHWGANPTIARILGAEGYSLLVSLGRERGLSNKEALVATVVDAIEKHVL